MTTYTGFGTGTPAVTYGADTAAYTLATNFTVTVPGLVLTKGRIYLSSNGGAVTAANVLSGGNLQFGLFPQTDGAFSLQGAMTPNLITPVVVSSLTMDAWNEAVLSTPYALTVGSVYYASWLMPAGRYSYISGEFVTDVVAGPITFVADGTHVPLLGIAINGGYVPGGAALAPVLDHAGSTWYGIDIEVSTVTVDGTGSVATRRPSVAGTVAETLATSGHVAAARLTPAATGSESLAANASVAMRPRSTAGTVAETVTSSASAAAHAMAAVGGVSHVVSGTVALRRPGVSGTGRVTATVSAMRQLGSTWAARPIPSRWGSPVRQPSTWAARRIP